MSALRPGLQAEIESFDIDGDAVGLPFVVRLARENGWSRTYADRVIAEYKRFVYLSMLSNTPVCPSEDVDAAWHMHLTYTRSYWKRFCEGVLGRPLHHEPTKGGPAEHSKHLAMYNRTLALYRETFGTEAPQDIWTPTDDRFGSDLAHRVVNTARNWVIPKTPVKRVAQLAVAFGVVAVFVPGCEGGPNPFALKGTDFLVFLIPMIIAACCVGRVIRTSKRGPAPEPDDDNPGLTWEQTAYLAGGAARLTTAAVARLVARGAAHVEGPRLVRGHGEALDGAGAVERAVYSALPVTNTAAELGPVAKAVDATYADEAKKLEADGYLNAAGTRAAAGFLGAVPLLIVLFGFALPRWLMGLADHKPLGFLIFTSILSLIFGLSFIMAPSLRLTRRGQHVLEKLKDKHRTLQAGAAWEGSDGAGMAIALFGTAVLAGSSIAFLTDWYPRQIPASSSSGCGTSGCGTGGCSGGAGGDGGGGGCGGGGCGGCGGGGGD